MMAVETIFVHRACRSQLVILADRPVYCEVCGRTVRREEINEVDNSPSPFAG